VSFQNVVSVLKIGANGKVLGSVAEGGGSRIHVMVQIFVMPC